MKEDELAVGVKEDGNKEAVTSPLVCIMVAAARTKQVKRTKKTSINVCKFSPVHCAKLNVHIHESGNGVHILYTHASILSPSLW